MKKEEIRIHVTTHDVKEFIEVLRRNGESIDSGVGISINWWWNVGFMYIKMNGTTWHICSTTLENKGVTEHPSFNWTPQDLEEYLLTEAQRILKEQNDFDKAIHAMHIHERPCVSDEQIKSSHVVKNADGTASSVTLRDDKVVVEMPNGTLRIVDKSNLYKIV